MKTKSLLIIICFFLVINKNNAQFEGMQNRIESNANTDIEKGIGNAAPEQNTQNSTNQNTNRINSNKNKEEKPGKIYFSDKPFANGTDLANAKTTFTAGQEIYGMIVMDKNFSEYTEDEDKAFEVTFYANLVNITGDGSSANTALAANIHQKYNKQNYLFFDVSPAPSKAVTYAEYNFMRIGNLMATIKGNETYGDKPKLGNKRTYEFEFKIGYKVFAEAKLDIDYTNATKETMKTWMAREDESFALAKTNTSKANDNEASNIAANLPLPKSFMKPSGNSYTDQRLTAAKITAMLKKMPEVKDVLKFMFVKTTAQAEFELYKTPLGVPDYKWGNRFFQFIFKDAKGKCLAAGGRIKMNYEGGGKYGAPFIIWELADVESNEGFLVDTELKAYVVDCSKLKK
jgi:hypothetical protein